jgi:uracil-DNA glycosylase
LSREILILGDAPGPNTDPRDPLFPHTTTGAAAHLATLMGLDREAYIARTRRLNVNHDGNQPLSKAEASDRLVGILDRVSPGSLIIMIGRAAAGRHNQTARLPWGEPIDFNGSQLLVIPHTSGRNRYWNDPLNKQKISQILREEIGRAT